jgi:hypothetical protein
MPPHRLSRPPGSFDGYPAPAIQVPLNGPAVMHQNIEPVRVSPAADAARRPVITYAPASGSVPATSAAFTIVRPAPASAASATSTAWPSAATSSGAPAVRDLDYPHPLRTRRSDGTRLPETRSPSQPRRPVGSHQTVQERDLFLPVGSAGTAAATPPQSHRPRPRRPAEDGFLPTGSDPVFPRGTDTDG